MTIGEYLESTMVIKKKGNSYVSTHPPFGLENMKVNTLIDHHTSTGRFDIITQIFNNIGLQQIQKLPILNVAECDA